MLIIKQKAQAGACKSGTEYGKITISQGNRNDNVGNRGNSTGTCSQTIQAIRQIDGITGADYHDKHEYIVKKSQINIPGSKRNPQRGRKLQKLFQDKTEHRSHNKLTEKFLLCRQT